MKIIYWINFYAFLVACIVGLLLLFHEIDFVSSLTIPALLFASPTAPIIFLTSIMLLISKAIKPEKVPFLIGWRLIQVTISLVLSAVYVLGLALFWLASQAFRF